MHVCVFSISLRIFGSTGSVQFGIKKNALLDEREVVNVLASQSGESSSGYSVFIGREESERKVSFFVRSLRPISA